LKTYGHLTSEERAQIEILHKEGEGPTAIGVRIGRAKSTVSVELRRLGELVPYEGAAAQRQADELAGVARVALKVTPGLRAEIRRLLGLGWSPQQIAGRWKKQGVSAGERVSHETIYGIIAADRQAGGTLWQRLPRGGKKRRRDRCGTRRGHRLVVKPEQEIAVRPERINERSEYGHWEADLVIGAGQQGVLLVAVERQSRLVRLECLPSKEALVVEGGLRRILDGEVVKSLTYDRGLEWMRHEAVALAFGAVSWFCLPYHSWEKGAVENMNGLIRRYFPKKEPFPYEEVEAQWVKEVEALLNGRPRRILEWRTPLEAAARGLAA